MHMTGGNPFTALMFIVSTAHHSDFQQFSFVSDDRHQNDGGGTSTSRSRFPPVIVLYLIHFILFQNMFEIAFFLWIWSTYGFKSCIMEVLNFIIPRLVIGIILQVLCSYSTLPLYALVSQMGTMFKQTVFDQYTKDMIMTWISDTKHSSSVADGSMNRLTTESTNSTYIARRPVVDAEITTSEIELSCPTCPNNSDS